MTPAAERIATRHRRRWPAIAATLTALAMAVGAAVCPARAADTTAVGDSVRAEAPAAPGPGFPVLLGPNELFRIHAAVRGRGAEERAQTISHGLVRLAREPGFAPESIRVVEGEFASEIVSGDVLIMGAWDADTIGTGRSRQQIAQERAGILRAAIPRYRADNSMRTLLMAALWTVLATLGLVLALALLGRLHARVRGMARTWLDARRDFIKKKSFSLLEMEQVASFLGGVGGLVHVLLVVGAIYLYVSTVLAFFPATRPLSGRLATFVLEPFRVLGLGFIDHLPGYIFLAILFWGTAQLIRLLKLLFVAIEAGRLKLTGFYPEWAMPTYRLVRILAVALAVVVGYPYIPGSESDAFKGVSIFFGLLVSLGSSSMVSNVVAGIVITYMRSFRIGDVVQVGEHRGRVVETTMFVTRIRTIKNVEISIPNSLILGSNVVNYTAQAAAGLVLHSEVTIGYQWPWRQVHALLLRAAERTEGLLPEPKPFVLQRTLADFGVEYQINVLTDQPHRMDRIYSQLHRNIQDQFNEFGVEIMTPAYEGDRSEPTLSPKEGWYAPPAKQPGEPGADE